MSNLRNRKYTNKKYNHSLKYIYIWKLKKNDHKEKKRSKKDYKKERYGHTWKIPWRKLVQINLRNDFNSNTFSHDLPFQVILKQLNISWMKTKTRWERSSCSCHLQSDPDNIYFLVILRRKPNFLSPSKLIRCDHYTVNINNQ